MEEEQHGPGIAPGREFWYIACASSQLSERPRGVRVLDQEVVVYRDGQGGVGAMADRCCHRGVKLSLGRVTNGYLACGYHGWRYDAGGRCVHIPSLCDGQDIPRGAAVRGFPCVEQDAYIWVWTGHGAPVPTAPARIDGFESCGWRQGVCFAACSASMLMENQIDSAHPLFAHEGSHPSYFLSRLKGAKESEFEVRVTAEGVIAFYPPTTSADDPVPAEPVSMTTYQVPNRIQIRQRLFLMEDLFIVLHVVPTGANSCRLEWLQRDRKREGIQWVSEETRILKEDRVLLESAQPAYDLLGDALETSVPVDFATHLLRRAIRTTLSADWPERLSKLPKRHIVRARI